MPALGDIASINHNITHLQSKPLKSLFTIICEDASRRLNRTMLREFEGFTYEEGSDEYLTKLEDIKTKLTYADLVSVCHVLDIKYDGTEDDVRQRILTFLCHVEAKDEQRDQDDDDEEESNEENEMNKSKDEDEPVVVPEKQNTTQEVEKTKPKKSKRAEHINDDEDEEARNYDVMRKQFATCSITFRDMEDSIRRYNGKDGYPIVKWIDEFEELAELAGWNDFQKVIYAKKLLDELAKLLVQSEKGVTTWYRLKTLLKKEFEEKVSSAEVHRTLMNRSKKKDETVQEYTLVMREIASRAYIEPEITIQYILDGIPDDPANKMILYGAKNFEELKVKIKLYETIHKRSSTETNIKEKQQPVREKQRGAGKPPNAKEENPYIRCYGCGRRGHLSKDCPNRDRGVKCFKCNEFGHKAGACSSRTTDNSAKNAMLIKHEENHAVKNISIQGQTMSALFDTGSDVNLIRHTDFLTLGPIPLQNDTITLTGIGGIKVNTLGNFRTDVKADEVMVNTKIHVVASDTLKIPVVIGQEFLKNAIIKMDTSGLTIMNKENDDLSVEEAKILNIVCDAPVLDLSHITTPELKNKIEQLYENYDPRKKTKETSLKMKIILKNETPISYRPRRLAYTEKLEVDKQMEEWLREGVIRPSQSEFASPIVLVKKKNGAVRICQDYRKLNEQVVKDRYPLPLIEDQLDRLQGSRIFSTLDLKNGFFHVPIDEESRKYTSFVTPTAQYEFIKTPFGLCNSPSMFQRFINTVFTKQIKEGILLTYMDDLVILAQNEEEAVERLAEVLKTAEAYGLQIQWKKCQFLKTSIDYLGHQIEDGKIKPSSAKVDAVIRFPKPTTVKQVQSFLGLTGYFRKFVKNYSMIARPLSNLTRQNVPFTFGDEENKAFEKLKRILATKPVLGIYDVNAVTELHTDACMDGFGAILLQKNDTGELHPIFYMSRKTSEAERKYSSYELEVLAIIYALRKFRVYLLGSTFKIVTDCSAFTLTMKKQDLCTRVARWAMLLSEFHYSIEHRPGNRMKHADALSRNSVMLVVENELIASIESAQSRDEHLRIIRKLLTTGQPYKDYLLKNDLIYREYEGRTLLVVPELMQADIVKKFHEDNGHFATKKTKDLILRDFWFPKIQEKIEECIRNCIPCILSEKKKGKAEGFLNPISKDELPLTTYHIDHLGPMAATGKGYKYLFVVVDGFSKFVWLYPTKSVTSQEVISKLEIQKHTFGNPKRIIADRGTAFTSTAFEDYCRTEKIDLIHITTGVARANGQVERINRTIIPILTKLSPEDETKWYKQVENVQRALNRTHQRSIDTSPFKLLFGVQMRHPNDPDLQELIEKEYRKTFVEDREDVRRAAKEQILKVQEENRRNYDKRRKPGRTYRNGDLIAIKRTQFTNLSKLKKKFLGPYRITETKGHDRYDVERVGPGDGPKKTSTAVDFMKPWALYSDVNPEEDDSEEDDHQDDETDHEDEVKSKNGRVVGRDAPEPPMTGSVRPGTAVALRRTTREQR